MFITFEGIEGCGKSTQAKRLFDRLTGLKIPVVSTLEPGGTLIGRSIRHILLDSRNQDLAHLAELFLYAADRAQHVEQVIRPALAGKNWVICDRFFDATTSYQGYGRGLDLSLIQELNQKATSGLRPDITLLVDCPVEVGLERALSRNKIMQQEWQARFEEEAVSFHAAIRKGYLALAHAESDRFIIVDGTLSRDELEAVIFEKLEPFIVSAGVDGG